MRPCDKPCVRPCVRPYVRPCYKPCDKPCYKPHKWILPHQFSISIIYGECVIMHIIVYDPTNKTLQKI